MIPSLESDKRTDLWPNDSLTFTFYLTFLNSLPYWTRSFLIQCLYMLECFQTHSNKFKRVQTRSNTFKRVQTPSNAFKHVQTCSNAFKHIWNKLVVHSLPTLAKLLLLDSLNLRDILFQSAKISPLKKNSLFKVCLFWPSFCCLIHFILRTYYSNQSRYLLWYKFFVQSLSILIKLLFLPKI